MTPWLSSQNNDTARQAALAAILPRVETERLILRAPRLADWEQLEEIWTGPRSTGIGGPFEPEDAYLDFCQQVAGWLLRGFGPLTVETRDEQVVGLIALGHEWGDPEPEIGWLFTAAGEGHGYASEAAKAMVPAATALFGSGNVVSYCDPANARSIRILQAVGARRDPQAEAHFADDPIQVWRHGQTGGGAA